MYLLFHWTNLTDEDMLLDNSDGKQAVRTGSSSPLGEMLDHGCDSMIIGVSSPSVSHSLRSDGHPDHGLHREFRAATTIVVVWIWHGSVLPCSLARVSYCVLTQHQLFKIFLSFSRTRIFQWSN